MATENVPLLWEFNRKFCFSLFIEIALSMHLYLVSENNYAINLF